MRHFLALATLALIMGFTASNAKPYLYEEANIEINYPDDWSIEVPADYEDYEESEEFDENIYLAPPKEDLLVIAAMIWEVDFSEAEQMVKDLLLEENESVKLTKKSEIDVNGMKAIIGEGKVNVEPGVENDLYYAVIETPEGNMLVYYAMEAKSVIEKYKEKFEGMVKATVSKPGSANAGGEEQ